MVGVKMVRRVDLGGRRIIKKKKRVERISKGADPELMTSPGPERLIEVA
jgi:hypothetical protein